MDLEQAIYEKCERLGLQPRRTEKGYSILCPKHEDTHRSAIVYVDDGYAQCFAQCGRWNFMKGEDYVKREKVIKPKEHKNFKDTWLELDLVDQDIKGIPKSHLNKLGWRKYNGDIDLPANVPQLGLMPGIFIPAFSQDRSSIPYCQIRHLSGERRFSFVSGATQIPFGLENLDNMERFVVFTEGNTDRAVLELAGIHAVAMPSGSSGRLLQQLGEYCRQTNKILVAISDNDKVGDKLLETLNGLYPCIDARVKGYKDINEAYLAKGIDWIKEHYKMFINKKG